MEPTIDSEWFYSLFREKDMSLRTVAERIDMDSGGLSRTLRGHRRMQMKEAQALANLLRVPIDEIVRHAGISDTAPPPPLSIHYTILPDGSVTEATAGEEKFSSDVSAKIRSRLRNFDYKNYRLGVIGRSAGTDPWSFLTNYVLVFDVASTRNPVGELCLYRSVTTGNLRLGTVIGTDLKGESDILLPGGERITDTIEHAQPVMSVISP